MFYVDFMDSPRNRRDVGDVAGYALRVVRGALVGHVALLLQSHHILLYERQVQAGI